MHLFGNETLYNTILFFFLDFGSLRASEEWSESIWNSQALSNGRHSRLGAPVKSIVKYAESAHASVV